MVLALSHAQAMRSAVLVYSHYFHCPTPFRLHSYFHILDLQYCIRTMIRLCPVAFPSCI